MNARDRLGLELQLDHLWEAISKLEDLLLSNRAVSQGVDGGGKDRYLDKQVSVSAVEAEAVSSYKIETEEDPVQQDPPNSLSLCRGG